MTLDVEQTVAKFITPIQNYLPVARVQSVILALAVTTPDTDLAARRLLAFFEESDLRPLFRDAVTLPLLSDLTTSQIEQVTPLQDLIANFRVHGDLLTFAISESAKFLPNFTVDLLERYNTDGAPLERINAASFIVLAATLQG